MARFTPTSEMIKAAETVFLAMAYTESIRPIVEGYQKAILQKHQFTNKKKVESAKLRGFEREVSVILDPKYDYELSDEDFQIYLEECNIEREKAGLKVESKEHCPLLVAEHLERNAKRHLLEVIQPITKIDPSEITDMDHYNELVELILKLLVNFIDQKTILNQQLGRSN